MVDVPVAAAESALLPSPDHPLAAALLLVVCLAIAGVLTLLSDSIDRAVVPEDDGEDDDGERESYARHLARQGSLGEAADLGAQACDQQPGAENREHRCSPQPVTAGDQNETQQQHHSAPNTIAGAAEFNGQKGKQQECQAKQKAEIAAEGREHPRGGGLHPFWSDL